MYYNNAQGSIQQTFRGTLDPFLLGKALLVSEGFVEEVMALLAMSMMQNECPWYGVAGVELKPMVVSSPWAVE